MPVYISATRFKIALYEAARDTAATRGTTTSLRERIMWSAHNLDIPLRPEDLHVEVDLRSRLVSARAAYVMPVDLFVTRMELKFHDASSQLPIITAADFKPEAEPGSHGSSGDTPATGARPSVSPDWATNPPSTSNSQSAN